MKTENKKCWWEYGIHETHLLLVKTEKGAAVLEKNLVVSYQVKPILTTQSSNDIPR